MDLSSSHTGDKISICLFTRFVDTNSSSCPFLNNNQMLFYDRHCGSYVFLTLRESFPVCGWLGEIHPSSSCNTFHLFSNVEGESAQCTSRRSVADFRSSWRGRFLCDFPLLGSWLFLDGLLLWLLDWLLGWFLGCLLSWFLGSFLGFRCRFLSSRG